MVIFSNPGEIDIEAVKTMGASIKEDSAIGFFGTGLKFAIAVLLRNGLGVQIHSGENIFRFGVKSTEIRGKGFDVATINGESMGFTTELGKTWHLWMAYRELYCNALDEGGSAEIADTAPGLFAGQTSVIVTGHQFEAEHHNRHEHFIIDRTPMQVIGDVEIYDGDGAHVFYKGVRIFKLTNASRFTYNITSQVELNEDRTAKNSYSCAWKIAHAIGLSTDKHFIRSVILAGDHNYEFHLDLNNYSYSEEFAEVALAEYRKDCNAVNKSIRPFVHKLAPAKVFDGMFVPLSRVQSVMLERAKAFAGNIGFSHEDYPIKIVETLGPSVMAMACKESNEIIFSKASFEMGTKFIAATLIEEIIHLREGLDDETRSMQTYLFNKIISLGEELSGEPI